MLEGNQEYKVEKKCRDKINRAGRERFWRDLMVRPKNLT